MWTVKIDRAKQHMVELRKEIKNFSDTHPYKISTKRDPLTNHLIYYVARAESLPLQISLITGDIIHNLRSALDHLAYELFIVNLGNATNARHIYFPIAENFELYKKNKIEMTKGITQKAKDLIDTVRPYKGGSNTIWEIHRLDIIDKHRSILLVILKSSLKSVDLGPDMLERMKKSIPNLGFPEFSLPVQPADNLFPLEVSDELYDAGLDAEENQKIRFEFNPNIIFNEQGIIEGKPLIETIQSMIDEVENLVPKFESLVT